MKTIIAGSRDITNYDVVLKAISDSEINITEVVCGMAKGVDSLGREWAIENNIPVTEFFADWETWGRFAGPKRNREMAEYADALIAVWNEHSPGTKNMINQARARGLRIYIHLV